MRWWEGYNHNKIKSHNCWVGDSQTGEQLYHTSPPTGVKVLSSRSGFPTWGSGNERRTSQRIRLWRLVGFDCRTLTGLGETETPLLEDTHKVVCESGPRGKEQWPHGRLNQTYLLVFGGSPAEVGGGCGSWWGQRHWQQKFWEVLLGMSPPRVHH